MSDPTLLWEPPAELVESCTMTRFMRWLDLERGLRFDTYDELWQWSVDDLEAFWAAIWHFFAVDADAPYERVLGSREMPGAEWFPGVRISYAEHMFRGKEDDAVAILHAAECREGVGEWTWRDLREHTARIRGGLRAMGVGRGDRVAAYMPNIPETIAAFLATASLGAIWSSAAPEFGVQ